MRRALAAWLAACAAAGCTPDAHHLGDLPALECDDPSAHAVLDACFQRTATEVEISFSPLHLLPGDFDADARVDLLAIGTLDAVTTERFSGGARGPEGPPIDRVVTGCSAYPVAGRLDGDATDDVLYAGCETSVEIHPGGPVAGRAPMLLEVGLQIRSMVISDLDTDGDRDLVVLGGDAEGAPALAFALSDAGSLGVPTIEPMPAMSFDPLGLHAADLDGEGHPDLVIREGLAAPRIAIRLATGPASYGEWRAIELPAVPRTLVLADLLGEGRSGIVFADRDGARVCVLADVQVDAAATCLDLPEIAPASVAATDLDGDGAAELVVADDLGDELTVLARTQSGTLEPVGELPVPEPTDLVYVQDVNGEGTADVIAGHFAARAFSIRLGLP